jgi:hypothetical protein
MAWLSSGGDNGQVAAKWGPYAAATCITRTFGSAFAVWRR